MTDSGMIKGDIMGQCSPKNAPEAAPVIAGDDEIGLSFLIFLIFLVILDWRETREIDNLCINLWKKKGSARENEHKWALHLSSNSN